jgi:hypothetical protein
LVCSQSSLPCIYGLLVYHEHRESTFLWNVPIYELHIVASQKILILMILDMFGINVFCNTIKVYVYF